MPHIVYVDRPVFVDRPIPVPMQLPILSCWPMQLHTVHQQFMVHNQTLNLLNLQNPSRGPASIMAPTQQLLIMDEAEEEARVRDPQPPPHSAVLGLPAPPRADPMQEDFDSQAVKCLASEALEGMEEEQASQVS